MRKLTSDRSNTNIWNTQASIYQKFTEEEDLDPDHEFLISFILFYLFFKATKMRWSFFQKSETRLIH